MISEARLRRSLRVLQPFLYLALVSLWFKESLPALKGIPLSPVWAFIPLAAVTILRLLLWTRSRSLALPPGWKKDAAALGILVVLVTLVHIPFLAHSFGLMDSDEAVPALMGKHIAEGRRPPLFFYGAFFQGSLAQHYTAAFFKLFGYSVFLAKLSALLAFVLFLGAQFFLLRKVFSFGFACAVGAFYALPWVELTRASLDLGSGFPVVLLFGVLTFYWTVSIVFDGRVERLAGLGFLLGLAFWTHQISAIFALAAAPFLVGKLRLHLRSYLTLAAYSLVGAFPLLLNEFASGFPLVRFLAPGEAGPPLSARLARTGRILAGLFASGHAPSAWVWLAVLAAGLATLISLVVLKKIRTAALVYPVFFVAFLGVYIVSRFSSADVVRYMYILFVAVPVLLAAPFLWVQPRIRYPTVTMFFILIFVSAQARAAADFYSTVRSNHRAYARAVAAMIETGEKYWISDFWVSYLLTSLSGEKLIVASYGVRRYYPYELWYWNEGRNNWVFFRDTADMGLFSRTLPDSLNKTGVGFKQKDVDGFTLIYDVSQDIFPKIILADPPGLTPDVRLATISSSKGRLALGFVRSDSRPTPGLGCRVEIPGYSVRLFPMSEKTTFSAEIPFPEEPRLRIRYGLTYAGLLLRRSIREQEYVLTTADRGQRREPVEFLKGIGPQKDVLGRSMSICAKEACFEINEPAGEPKALVLELYSFLDFANPFWYGDFSQSVAVFVNGRLLGERPLAYGGNRVAIDLDPSVFRGRGDVVRLVFRYAMPFAGNENWKTAAFLERVGFE